MKASIGRCLFVLFIFIFFNLRGYDSDNKLTQIYPSYHPVMSDTSSYKLSIWGNSFNSPQFILSGHGQNIVQDTVTVVNQNLAIADFSIPSTLPLGVYKLIVYDGVMDTLYSCITFYKNVSGDGVFYTYTVAQLSQDVQGVWVGDGDNDSLMEVFVSGKDNTIHMYEWSDSSWVEQTVGSSGGYMIKVTVGDGNNDGLLEVYGVSDDDSVYQFAYNGTSWEKTVIGSGTGFMKSVAVGDGNCDGFPEVYAAGADSNVYMFSFDGTNWNTTTIGKISGTIHALAINDGTNDGKLEVYASAFDGGIYQFSWNGSSWAMDTLLQVPGVYIYGVWVGDGDNDTLLEVYGAVSNGDVYQIEWNGSSWDTTRLGTLPDQALAVKLGDGDNDGLNEVYVACDDGNIYRFEFDGSNWTSSIVGSGSSYMHNLALGDGDNDGFIEVYGANYDDRLYMFRFESIQPDIASDSILLPRSGWIPGGNYHIRAVVGNYGGGNANNVYVFVSVIDTVANSEIFRDTILLDSLPAKLDTTVVFEPCYYTPGSVYRTIVYVNYPDTNPANDTTSILSATKDAVVLFVEDANGYGAPNHPDSTWLIPLTNLLGENRVAYFGPTSSYTDNGPDIEEMRNVDLVIWNCYDYYVDPQLTSLDTSNIKTIIDEGKRVWLIGQDIIYSLLGKKGIKGRLYENPKALNNFLGTHFGLSSYYEDYYYGYDMKIQGINEASSPVLNVSSDFYYDGKLYPDELTPDTTMSYPILIDPDSNYTIGIIRKDSMSAFWAADGRGVDYSSGSDWESLIEKMLNLLGISTTGKSEEKEVAFQCARNLTPYISFSYNGKFTSNVFVYDIIGRLILKKTVYPGMNVVLNRLPQGVYLLAIPELGIKQRFVVVR
ncbi:hypothetical protein DRQ23_01185 [bacterium]|nr:MAG: hypothetical protein DRQ23_01185 [bacterium]